MSPTAELSPDATGVSLDQVRHVADLANLELTAEELPRLARDLNAILGHIAQLNELDTTEVPPMAQVSEALGIAPAAAGETLRPDEIKLSLDRAEVMAQTPETDGRFFKVPKVIER
jgi:aspartyl-tRNA(Asn)/glutamyl-tRNA(Gln) amidotransferase subunit C